MKILLSISIFPPAKESVQGVYTFIVNHSFVKNVRVFIKFVI